MLLALGSGRQGTGEPNEDAAIFATDRMLRLELAKLGEGLGAKALRAALGLDRADPRTLTYRRHDFGEAHNKHPDTVESHENRAINELALRILGQAKPPFVSGRDLRAAGPDRGVDPGAGPEPSAQLSGTAVSMLDLDTATSSWGDIRLVRGYHELLDRLLAVVRSAEECLVTTGSRSRDPEYLQTIEDRVASTGMLHYRVLCGPPHWSVLKSHLLRLQQLRAGNLPGGNPRILIGLQGDFRREPERFICANERRAVLILPSLTGLEHYDTGLELDGREYGTAYVRLVQEMYAASQPVETEEDIVALPLIRE